MPGAEGTGSMFTFPKLIPVSPGTGCTGQLQPVPTGVVPRSHRWLPWHPHHQLHYVLAQRLGLLCHPAPILPRQDVSCQRGWERTGEPAGRAVRSQPLTSALSTVTMPP